MRNTDDTRGSGSVCMQIADNFYTNVNEIYTTVQTSSPGFIIFARVGVVN
jgi:hypothetical protein